MTPLSSPLVTCQPKEYWTSYLDAARGRRHAAVGSNFFLYVTVSGTLPSTCTVLDTFCQNVYLPLVDDIFLGQILFRTR